MSNAPALFILLHNAFIKAQADVCDKPRSKEALDRLIRVREVQLRAARHYKRPLVKGVRAC
jgi:hypothetical protein